ncbi:unnamed protein product, partial [Musa textilis]
ARCPPPTLLLFFIRTHSLSFPADHADPFRLSFFTKRFACSFAVSLSFDMDEKWKLSKKESRNSGSGSRRAVTEGSGPFAKESASAREGQRGGRRRRTTTARSFSSRCASVAKEQRAKFYIVRRCVTMLICWRDYP